MIILFYKECYGEKVYLKLNLGSVHQTGKPLMRLTFFFFWLQKDWFRQFFFGHPLNLRLYRLKKAADKTQV